LTTTSAKPIIHEVRLQVLVEVSGCPTTCMHCWALGGNYGSMPLGDAAFALDELAKFCGKRELRYTAYPMHEVTAHPEAPDVIRLFTPHLGQPYDPILTPGTPLASREDWEEIIVAAKECGATALWVAFHGFGEEHDRQLNRPGAFEETCLAVRRAQECGLVTGANVFLTKPGLRDFDRLLAVLFDLQLREMSITPAAYTPTSRGRRYETLRPELEDLIPVAQQVLATSRWNREAWSDLPAHTEAAWVRRALERDWPAPGLVQERFHQLVCRPNLDLYTGTTGVYRRRHGNLRRDGAQRVLERALADGPISSEEIYFPGAGAFRTSELAAKCGDPEGTRVYFEHDSIRSRWLDLNGSGM
jgi:hypothetical protein